MNSFPRGRLSIITLVGLTLLTCFGVSMKVEAQKLDCNGGGNGCTDNKLMTHRSIECNRYDFLRFNHFVYYTYKKYASITNLSERQLSPRPCGSASKHDDVYWYATRQSNFSSSSSQGDYRCFRKNFRNACDRGRIRFLETRVDRNNWNLVCHEIGHHIGFSHGTSRQNCMDGGNNAVIDNNMRRRINSRYR